MTTTKLVSEPFLSSPRFPLSLAGFSFADMTCSQVSNQEAIHLSLGGIRQRPNSDPASKASDNSYLGCQSGWQRKQGKFVRHLTPNPSAMMTNRSNFI